MVGPLTILKMIHCRNITSKKKTTQRKRRLSTRETAQNESDLNLNADVKVEVNNELCRVCLREGKIPIYEENTTKNLTGALSSIGGIEVSIDDPYPKYLCQACHALLQGALLFRKTAQQSDELLKKPKKQEPEPETDELINDYSDVAADNDDEVSYEIEERKVKIPSFLTCKLCSLQFSSFQEYSDHRLSAEHENKRLLCPVCKNNYAPQYFKRHMALHKKETSYMCDICGKKFIVHSQFTRHHLTHFYSLPYKCSLCPYKGRFSESLKMHMRSHTGEKPYQCTQCPSRFINKSNLNKHTLTHKGEHDYRCEVCGRGFYTKRDLDMHFKVDHTGIKEHICRICDKAFGYRKQMMKHELKVHKREKLKSGRMPIYLKIANMKQKDNITHET